ncbi:Fic family protein [[Acholeplasma] multilocale]|uniref:Fic family protein n=1 Tax=[Acholeplasma] multilocale TaxID=264638 RepID=UPI00047D2878|nr:Fic family protein [[Acholeplasma] multilocale]
MKYQWLLFSESDFEVFKYLSRITPGIEVNENKMDHITFTVLPQLKCKMDLELLLINLDEQYCEILTQLIVEAHVISTKIGTNKSDLYGVKNIEHLSSMIFGLVQKWIIIMRYDDNYGLLDMAINLLYILSTNQYFYNGNKRTAMFTFILFLRNAGLLVKYNSVYHNESKWEDLINQIVERHERRDRIVDILKSVMEFLDSILLISHEYYKKELPHDKD